MYDKPMKFIYQSKLAKKLSWFSLFWALLYTPASCSRVLIYINSSEYKPSTFIVTDAGFSPPKYDGYDSYDDASRRVES